MGPGIPLATMASPYRFGLSPVPRTPPPSGVAPAGVASAVHTAGIPEPKMSSPAHPMFWLGGLILVAVGAAGISGAVRVGPVRAGVAAGKA